MKNIHLFLVGSLVLFLEMALIRFVGTEIRIFAYFNNLTLLACFLGFGGGCYLSNKKSNLWVSMSALVLLLSLIALPIRIDIFGTNLHLFKNSPEFLSVFTDSLIWNPTSQDHVLQKVMLGLFSTAIVLILLFFIFLPLGQEIGKAMNRSKHLISSYSFNVLGSLAGLWMFAALSFFQTPPWIWFAVALVIFIPVLNWRDHIKSSLAGVVILLMASFLLRPHSSQILQSIWSPYQKLEMRLYRQIGEKKDYVVSVNNVGYMLLLNLSDQALKNVSPDGVKMRDTVQYDIPYSFKPNPGKVLIVGSGGGNDVAGGLRHGAGLITAVEIDPGVVQLGLHHHPEKPYSDSRVHVVINDARTFLKASQEKFDLVIFGLLDSHTLGSSFNNTRLDHYVYTMESFEEARDRLNDNGVLVLAFSAQREWIAIRLKFMLEKAFSMEPVVFRIPQTEHLGWGGIMFVVGKNSANIHQALSRNPVLADFVKNNQLSLTKPIRPTTDNWPYLYLRTNKIPTLYLAISLLILTLSLAGARLGLNLSSRFDPHFFLLGAGFLLIEFQNISKTCLLFGSTWMVINFTITAILLWTLLANWLASRWNNMPLAKIYLGLFASLIIIYVIPIQLFNFLSFGPRVILVNLLFNSPVFFSGLIFIESFRQAKQKSLALGSNLLGAGLGGLLESLSFITGIQFLIILTITIYAGSQYFCPARSEGRS